MIEVLFFFYLGSEFCNLFYAIGLFLMYYGRVNPFKIDLSTVFIGKEYLAYFKSFHNDSRAKRMFEFLVFNFLFICIIVLLIWISFDN